MQTISVITCTYNPNPKIFERVLRSIECQSIGNFDIEYVIVDNNSNPPVSEMPCVQAFLARNAWAKIVIEKKQGLTYARLAGANATKGDILIFVDDDNELHPEYLKNVMYESSTYSWVRVLGPGKIKIDYCDKELPKYLKRYEGFFAVRDFDAPQYVKMKTLPLSIFPQGNGQVIRRDIFSIYADHFLRSNGSITGRAGNSLSSWEDIQIDWVCIKHGYAVGVFPSLSLTHIIPSKRVEHSYIKKLSYSINKSCYQAYLDIFPEEKSRILNSNYRLGFLISVTKLLFSSIIRRSFSTFDIEMCALIGRMEDLEKISKAENTLMVKLLKLLFRIQ